MTGTTRKILLAAACVAGGAALLATGGTAAAQPDDHQRPPDGARAVVAVTPNPTTERGQWVVITGHCGGGTGLRQVIGGSPEHPTLTDVEIVDPDPAGFLARARLAGFVGNGVGPVLVDCGGQAGVTLLVTHV
jgi:hypothetical protein